MRLFSPHRRLWIALVLLSVVGCTLNNAGTTGVTVSGAPTVRILAPQPNATYMEGVAVNLQASVSNAGKDIDRVEIVVDGSTIATLSQPNPNGAMSFNVTHGWSAAGLGAHSISVVVYRGDGSASDPASVEISVIALNGQGNVNQQPTQNTQPQQPTATTAQSNVQTNTQPTQNTQPQQPTAAQATPVPPTSAPAASNTPSVPTATFAQGINVRRGPGLEFDPPIGAFAAGQSAEILAMNPAGTWYKVRYGGGEGWVYATLAQASGDVASLPRDPGPPAPTAAPPTAVPPTAAPVSASNANLVAGIVVLDPSQPTCQQTFNIGLDVANLGSDATAASGTVSVTDVRTSDGSTQQTTVGGFPVLQPQQTFRVTMPFTVSTYYNEDHTIILVIDPNGQIPENNEGDNRTEIHYTLQKGNC